MRPLRGRMPKGGGLMRFRLSRPGDRDPAANLRKLVGLAVLLFPMISGCVPPVERPDPGTGESGGRNGEVRSRLTLTPDQWRIARKYAAVAREFYGFAYVPARVERYSDTGKIIAVDMAFRMADGTVRRVRVTGTLSETREGDDRRTARVEPLPDEPGTP